MIFFETSPKRSIWSIFLKASYSPALHPAKGYKEGEGLEDLAIFDPSRNVVFTFHGSPLSLMERSHNPIWYAPLSILSILYFLWSSWCLFKGLLRVSSWLGMVSSLRLKNPPSFQEQLVIIKTSDDFGFCLLVFSFLKALLFLSYVDP